MDIKWNKYPEAKPVEEGYYAVAEEFGNITTANWKKGKFSIDEYELDNGQLKLVTHVRYWAYLDEIIPKECRDGFIYEHRGKL